MKIKILLSAGLFIAAIWGGFFLMKNIPTNTDDVIKANYQSDSGCIQTYPNENHCLSESVGLYLDYLLETNNKTEFANQVKVLKDQFLIKTNHETFIRWQLNNDTSVNALIDDVRIIQALQKGSEQFKTKAYETLALKLTESLDKLNKDGIYVDFYDWNSETFADEITLSYITKNFAHVINHPERTIEILKEGKSDNVFFPENYALNEQKYTYKGEVHMVDQLLIAINRRDFGYSSQSFDEWLINTWKEDTLYGKYKRDTLIPTVNYESISVYAYLSRYFLMIDQEKLARDVADHAESLIDRADLESVHFFDYIQNQRMQEKLMN